MLGDSADYLSGLLLQGGEDEWWQVDEWSLCHVAGVSLWGTYSLPQGSQWVSLVFVVLIPDFNSCIPRELGSLLSHLHCLVLVHVSVLVWSSTAAVMNYSGQGCTHCPSRDDDRQPVLRPGSTFSGPWRWIRQWRQQEANQSSFNCADLMFWAGRTVWIPFTAFLPFAWDIEISQVSFSEHCKSCPSYVHFFRVAYNCNS